MTKNKTLINTLLSHGHSDRCFYCHKKMDPSARHPDPNHMTLEHLCPTTCHNAIPDNRLANLAIACKTCNNNKPSNCANDCVLESTIQIKFPDKICRVKRKTALKMKYNIDHLIFFEN